MLEAAIISLSICLCIYHTEALRGLLEKIVASISQSKSAVSIIIIGLVAGKAPTVSKSIGDLLDITITTSISMEFLTLDVEILSIQMASIGAILFGTKKENISQTGMAVFGLAIGIGAVFGHFTLASLMGDMEWMAMASEFLGAHPVYAVFLGVLVRSWKKAIGVAAILLILWHIELDTAFVFFLGAYIRMLIESWYAERK